MANLTIIFGLILALVGGIFYTATGMASITALIPAFIGVPLIVCGLIAKARPDWRMHVMHAAVAIALLGAIGAGMRLPVTLSEAGFNAAAIEMLIMLVLCLVYVGAGVRSFLSARRNRTAEPPQ